jgi:hypothetical protein
MPPTLRPTKEQVRAYMQQRQREFCCRPAPSGHVEYSPFSTLFLPGTVAQLAALIAVRLVFTYFDTSFYNKDHH